MNYDDVKNHSSTSDLRNSLEKSVKSQMMSDVPFGVLLSGGLDSSIISSIVTKYSKNRIESGDKKEVWWPRIHSFAVGLENSPDLIAARKVADQLLKQCIMKFIYNSGGFRFIRRCYLLS